MTEVIVSIPKEMVDKIRIKVNGEQEAEADDQSIVLWVLENYLDDTF